MLKLYVLIAGTNRAQRNYVNDDTEYLPMKGTVLALDTQAAIYE